MMSWWAYCTKPAIDLFGHDCFKVPQNPSDGVASGFEAPFRNAVVVRVKVAQPALARAPEFLDVFLGVYELDCVHVCRAGLKPFEHRAEPVGIEAGLNRSNPASAFRVFFLGFMRIIDWIDQKSKPLRIQRDLLN
jgi:hypothetical protein